MPHFHVWLRAGRSFMMQPTPYESRYTAKSVALRLRPAKTDRLVLACDGCPKPARSKAPSPGAVAGAVAADLDMEVKLVQVVLAAARAHRSRLKAEAEAP